MARCLKLKSSTLPMPMASSLPLLHQKLDHRIHLQMLLCTYVRCCLRLGQIFRPCTSDSYDETLHDYPMMSERSCDSLKTVVNEMIAAKKKDGFVWLDAATKKDIKDKMRLIFLDLDGDVQGMDSNMMMNTKHYIVSREGCMPIHLETLRRATMTCSTSDSNSE